MVIKSVKKEEHRTLMMSGVRQPLGRAFIHGRYDDYNKNRRSQVNITRTRRNHRLGKNEGETK